jgi:curved DNA-binding protein CbpA
MPADALPADPYRILDVDPRASGSVIKRRWRELAREHHPDRAAGDREEAARLTSRMARINAAYDLLRDPARRASYDQSATAWRSGRRGDGGPGWPSSFDGSDRAGRRAGPPPSPPTRPVTARFDTSAAFRPRNATLGEAPQHHVGQPPLSRPAPRPTRYPRDDLRASTPTGPVERSRSSYREPAPTLREAREAALDFGKFRGYTLGEVELLEPAYVDWIAQTITRDRELVSKARAIQAELDRQGVSRAHRSAAPGFGGRARAD